MSNWSLETLLSSLHRDIEQKLAIARIAFAHPATKGDASEILWNELLNTYLPERYRASKAHIVDSEGHFSDQIDVVIFDRQYSPFIFTFQQQKIIPAESVYAVFEAKQTANASLVEYSQKKVASVRRLHRTSLPIPYAKGTYPPKPPIPVIGGMLTLESDWSPALGASFENALVTSTDLERLDIGCVASHGHFFYDSDAERYSIVDGGKPATAFLFKLISRLQFSGTVPMIDVDAYARWLAK